MYVGISTNPEMRRRTHSRTYPIGSVMTVVGWYGTWSEASVIERRTIKEKRPPFNMMHNASGPVHAYERVPMRDAFDHKEFFDAFDDWLKQWNK